MGLPEKTLTTGQDAVMTPLLTNYQDKRQKLETAQKMHDDAVIALEECSKMIAEKLGIDVAKDYSFDIATKTFVDRAAIAASDSTSVEVKS